MRTKMQGPRTKMQEPRAKTVFGGQPAVGGRGRNVRRFCVGAVGWFRPSPLARCPAPIRAPKTAAPRLAPFAAVLFLFGGTLYAQRPAPAPAQGKSVLIAGATVHVGNGTVVPEGAVGFRAGKIDYVGPAGILAGVYDTVIVATGKHVYPGFILPASPLGLVEVEAVRATRDEAETGGINPSVRALVGYNTDSKLIPTIRSNGVLYAQVTPSGGLLSGTSSVVQLDAWNWQDAAIRTDEGIWLNWPPQKMRSALWEGAKEDEANEKRKEQLHALQLLFTRARVFDGGWVDLSLAALGGLFDGSKTLYINVSVAAEIRESVSFCKALGVKKVVVCGGGESHLVADFLKTENVPVLLDRLHSLPYLADDPYDLPYALPKLLQDAGVRYALTYTGGMEVMGSRNLPFLAGTAVRLGLTPEQALQSITLNAAQILGIDNTCGSLEVGKDASLFMSTGDALDMMTHNVELAFIQGRNISLRNHQTELYEQYKRKYNLR